MPIGVFGGSGTLDVVRQLVYSVADQLKSER